MSFKTRGTDLWPGRKDKSQSSSFTAGKEIILPEREVWGLHKMVFMQKIDSVIQNEWYLYWQKERQLQREVKKTRWK